MRQLLRTQSLRKRLGIDEAAGVAAVADFALALEGFDLEADDAPLHRNDISRDAHGRADQRRAEMADIDLGSDRDPAGLKMAPDGIAGSRHLFAALIVKPMRLSKLSETLAAYFKARPTH